MCQSARPNQQESLIPHDVPKSPWEKVDINLFQHRSLDYLLVTDYFNNFSLVRKCSNQTAAHVVSLLKAIFSEHAIPVCVFTEKGKQLKSAEFQEFVGCY